VRLTLCFSAYVCLPQASVTQQIQLWKHPVGKKRGRVLGELLNATPALLGPSIVPPDCSLAATPLLKTDPPALVKKAYRKAVRLVHPDKIAGVCGKRVAVTAAAAAAWSGRVTA
jgi:hypothetical protein